MVEEEETQWAEVKGQEDGRGPKGQRRAATLVLADEFLPGHRMTSSVWTEVTQDSFTDWDHLRINCVSFFFFFLLTTQSFRFRLFTLHLFLFLFSFHTHFWDIVVSKWPSQSSKPQLDTLCD